MAKAAFFIFFWFEVLFCLLHNSLNLYTNNYMPLATHSCAYVNRQSILCSLTEFLEHKIYMTLAPRVTAMNLRNWKLQERGKQKGHLMGQRGLILFNWVWIFFQCVLVNGFRSQNIHRGDGLCKKILKENAFSKHVILAEVFF